MKYVYIVHWLILGANGSEPRQEAFPIRDSAISFSKWAAKDAKNTERHRSFLGYGTFKCCTLDSAKIVK